MPYINTLWNVVGASVTGTSHRSKAIPCQDANQFLLLENGVLLIAVADGAGSARRSQLGAFEAVEAAIDVLHKDLIEGIPDEEAEWESLITKAFSHARRAVIQLAQDETTPVHDFATTLTLAVVDHEWLITGQIGDGVIVAQMDSGELFTATPPQRGEYANETFFLTMDNALAGLDGRIYRQKRDIEEVTALAVMTDGLIRIAMNVAQAQPHDPFFLPLLAFPAEITNAADAHESLINFLNSKRVNSRTDDDKTLVLAARPHLTTPTSL